MKNPPFNSLVWGSLRLTPITLTRLTLGLPTERLFIHHMIS